MNADPALLRYEKARKAKVNTVHTRKLRDPNNSRDFHEYSEELANEICTQIAQGKSLAAICRDPRMPHFVTVFDWRRKYPEFDKRYADARGDQADSHVEEMLRVARRKPATLVEAQQNRLLVDTLKWRATKMKPASWGDKITLDGEIGVRAMSDKDINARLAFLLTQTVSKVPELEPPGD